MFVLKTSFRIFNSKYRLMFELMRLKKNSEPNFGGELCRVLRVLRVSAIYNVRGRCGEIHTVVVLCDVR